MASRVAGKIKLQSVDELLGVPEIAGTQEIEMENCSRSKCIGKGSESGP